MSIRPYPGVLPCLLVAASIAAQETTAPHMQVPRVVPVPPVRHSAPPREPNDPPAREVHDPHGPLSLHLPAGWDLSTKDGEFSTFNLDARTAPRNAQLHLVASLAFNPYPQSTFSGARLYVSSASMHSAAACAAQTHTGNFQSLPPTTLDGVAFAGGKDEYGHSCTEVRDVAYTALLHGSCLRLDLVVNSFCGGEVSGAQDLTAAQLDSLYRRLQAILSTVHFKQGSAAKH